MHAVFCDDVMNHLHSIFKIIDPPMLLLKNSKDMYFWFGIWCYAKWMPSGHKIWIICFGRTLCPVGLYFSYMKRTIHKTWANWAIRVCVPRSASGPPKYSKNIAFKGLSAAWYLLVSKKDRFLDFILSEFIVANLQMGHGLAKNF